jgi:endogenous inhibitor of DNA gyrase (YacG/DUF329 family)
MVDLGRWADESYRVAAEDKDVPATEEPEAKE